MVEWSGVAKRAFVSRCSPLTSVSPDSGETLVLKIKTNWEFCTSIWNPHFPCLFNKSMNHLKVPHIVCYSLNEYWSSIFGWGWVLLYNPIPVVRVQWVQCERESKKSGMFSSKAAWLGSCIMHRYVPFSCLHVGKIVKKTKTTACASVSWSCCPQSLAGTRWWQQIFASSHFSTIRTELFGRHIAARSRWG